MAIRRLRTVKLALLGAVILAAIGGCGVDDETEAPTPGQRRIVSLSRGGSRSCGPAPAASFSFAEGTIYAGLREALLDKRNFGPGGVVPVTMVLRPTIERVLPRSLGRADILVINNPSGPIDETALAAMQAFVDGGGSILALGDDVSTYLAKKGECAADPDAAVTANVAAVTAGPFGPVGTSVATGYNCSFSALGPGVVVLAENEKGANALVLDAGAIRAGAGRVAAFGDDELFAGMVAPACGSGKFADGNANEALALNTFAFLALARAATE